jgi:polyisoprenoid-binding protein YceI
MSVTESAVSVPTGTWELDLSHSSANFSARHLMVSKVRGHFGSFSGTIDIADDPLESSVIATIDAASIASKDEQRDAHLKSPDFLDVENYPTLSFVSTGVRRVAGSESEYEVDGKLTVRSITKPVTLKVTVMGVQNDPWGGIRVGFEASTEFSRKDFGLEWNIALEGGGVVVGDKVKVELEVEAVRKDA